MMVNQAVPARVRRLINVESGLNDGIATPVVLVAIAGAAATEEAARTGPAAAVAELAIGLAVGAAVGAGGGWLIKVARRRGWVAEGFAGAAVLGLAACSYASSVALHGNGFIAAFVGGLGFAAAGGQAARFVPFVEETGALVSLLVWLLFGVVAVVPALESLTWQTAVYAVLSLTVIRMLPVAVALAGSGLGRATVVFVGWFGPRGLASVVFGLLALEALGEPAARPAIAVIAFTVLLSVVAHGLTAEPLARRYGARLSPAEHAAGAAGLTPVPERRLMRRSHVAAPQADAAGQNAAGEGGSG
jgi:NhaP-type Na+/H+ or K+/H+ antiporter